MNPVRSTTIAAKSSMCPLFAVFVFFFDKSRVTSMAATDGFFSCCVPTCDELTGFALFTLFVYFFSDGIIILAAISLTKCGSKLVCFYLVFLRRGCALFCFVYFFVWLLSKVSVVLVFKVSVCFFVFTTTLSMLVVAVASVQVLKVV